METTSEQLLECIDRYIEDLFVSPDSMAAGLAETLQAAESAGLPAIQVSPNEGKLLFLIARLTRAARILEIGTLGGYSTIWLARALPPDGALITLEVNPGHAAVADANLRRAGFAGQVEIRIGRASDTLRDMIASRTPPFDLIFIDADKSSYTEYLDYSLQLSQPGTVILADNVIRGGRVIDSPDDPADRGAKVYNEAIARHPRLDSLVLPILRARVDGLSLSIVK